MNKFVHLHVHTHYSLRDSIIKIPEYCKAVYDMKMSACAITDHGNLHGAIQFYEECLKTGIKPILGVEAYVTADPDNSEERTKDNYHLVLLAQNEDGWKRLIRLQTEASLENMYHNPRINIKKLFEDNTGLIALSACLGGVVAKGQKVKNDEVILPGPVYDEKFKTFRDEEGLAARRALAFKRAFGDRFYMEIQERHFWEQDAFNEWAIDFARQNGIPLVLTTDAHFLTRQDFTTHALVMANRSKKSLEEYQSGKTYYDPIACIRSEDEMIEYAKKMNAMEAVENTVKIADMCNVELQLKQYQYPTYDYKKHRDYEQFMKYKEKVREKYSYLEED